MIEMQVQGLTTEAGSGQHILWLWHADDSVFMPIVIGAAEAASIHPVLSGQTPPRPLPHDLMRSVLDYCNARVSAVHIVDVKDNTFYAELIVIADGRTLRLDARPSDSIALALRYRTKILVAEDILRQAAYSVHHSTEEDRLLGQPLEGGTPYAVSPRSLQAAIDELLDQTGITTDPLPAEAVQQRLRQLEEQLRQVLKLERYEDAERIQRQIAQLRNELGQ
jgi:uncharacterized protein